MRREEGGRRNGEEEEKFSQRHGARRETPRAAISFETARIPSCLRVLV